MSQQQQTAKITKGPSHAVPCPHCGHKLDFRQLQELGSNKSGKGLGGNLRVRRTGPNPNDLDIVSSGTGMVETGNKISCEKCGRMAMVVQVQTLTIVALRQTGGQVAPSAGVQAQAQRPAPQGGGFLQRWLGKKR